MGKMKNIVVLNITNNRLTSLPRGIGQLKRLEEFTAQ